MPSFNQALTFLYYFVFLNGNGVSGIFGREQPLVLEQKKKNEEQREQQQQQQGDCFDSAEEGTGQCQDWAMNGECNKNPEFMHEKCQFSCRLCVPEEGTSPLSGSLVQCADLTDSRQCREWAWHGECETNPEYMHNHCQKSCQLCPPGSIEALEFCEDAFEAECSRWAADDLCGGVWKAKKGKNVIDAAYVVEFCPKSCGVCDIHLDDRDFSLGLGLPQKFPDISNKHIRNRIKSQVAITREYIRSLDPELQEVCKMAHPFCARYALSTDCQDHADTEMMKYLCAASCQTCEELLDKKDQQKASALYSKALLEHHINQQFG